MLDWGSDASTAKQITLQVLLAIVAIGVLLTTRGRLRRLGALYNNAEILDNNDKIENSDLDNDTKPS